MLDDGATSDPELGDTPEKLWDQFYSSPTHLLTKVVSSIATPSRCTRY